MRTNAVLLLSEDKAPAAFVDDEVPRTRQCWRVASHKFSSSVWPSATISVNRCCWMASELYAFFSLRISKIFNAFEFTSLLELRLTTLPVSTVTMYNLLTVYNTVCWRWLLDLSVSVICSEFWRWYLRVYSFEFSYILLIVFCVFL